MRRRFLRPLMLCTMGSIACARPVPTTTPTPTQEDSESTEAEPAVSPTSNEAPARVDPTHLGLDLDAKHDPDLARLLRERDELEQLHGLAPLGASPLPEGAFEVRIWFRRPERRLAFRLWSDGDAIRGEARLWWSATRDADYVHAELTDWVDCRDRRSGVEIEACTIEMPVDFDWPAALRSLEAVDLWSLPHEPHVVGDEGYDSLLVELRDGPRFRAHHHAFMSAEDEEATPGQLVQALWPIASAAEWPYDEQGNPIKAPSR